MIFVTRPETPPESLRREDGKAAAERAAVMKFFEAAKNVGQKYPGDFKAYKERDVVKVINDIFAEKCAYCESPYGATTPVDVEHYRPKNAVFDEVTKKLTYPGYPWLAFEWTNLLASCIDCNRGREQEVSDGRRVVGKANRFPLVSERQRAKRPGDEKKEKPLLLNPCEDEVQEYFVYEETGFVMPKTKRGLRCQRAQVTIEVCGLLRGGLLRARREHLQNIMLDIRKFQLYEQTLRDNPGLKGAAVMALLELLSEKLISYLDPRKPYTALSRQFIEPVLAPYLSLKARRASTAARRRGGSRRTSARRGRYSAPALRGAASRGAAS